MENITVTFEPAVGKPWESLKAKAPAGRSGHKRAVNVAKAIVNMGAVSLHLDAQLFAWGQPTAPDECDYAVTLPSGVAFNGGHSDASVLEAINRAFVAWEQRVDVLTEAYRALRAYSAAGATSGKTRKTTMSAGVLFSRAAGQDGDIADQGAADGAVTEAE